VAGSEAIHIVEKVDETGLLRHFVPRKDTDYCGSFNLEMELAVHKSRQMNGKRLCRSSASIKTV